MSDNNFTIGLIEARLGGLQTALNTIQAEIAAARQGKADLGARLATDLPFQEKIADDYERLAYTVGEQSKKINSILSDLTAKAGTAQVVALQAQITNLREELEALKGGEE